MIQKTTVETLTSRNGQGDDLEPWVVPGDTQVIDINGEDCVALCRDGAAVWNNSDRCWVEVTPGDMHDRIRDRLLDLGSAKPLGRRMEEAAALEALLRDNWE